MPANVVTESERWVTNPDGSKRRRNASDLPRAASKKAATADESVGFSTPKTHKAADAQAAERGLTFPSNVKTVGDKAEFLASA